MGKVWGTIDQVNADDLLLVASAWDTASKTGEKNDFTANVVIGRLRTGGFVVLDVRGGAASRPISLVLMG
jgi:phage terminase large subunit-like protein